MVGPTRIHFQVTGDSHQGIGPSGFGRSAIGHRLQDPAAESRNEFPTANRYPLTANLKIPSSQRLRSGIAFAGGDDVAVKFRGELETR